MYIFWLRINMKINDLLSESDDEDEYEGLEENDEYEDNEENDYELIATMQLEQGILEMIGHSDDLVYDLNGAQNWK